MVLEVAVADELSEFENRVSPPAYFGPSGPSSVFTTPGGEALPSNTTGRYARIRATLTGTGTATPSLSDIQLSCNSGSDIPSQVRRYRYDEAGNLLQVTTTTDSGTSTDLRDDPSWSSGQRLNALYQIQRQDVGGHTWLYTYSDSGALLSNTNGTDTWTYTWDPVEDRLLRVQGPGGVDVNLTYDMAGRMLTRTSGGVTTTFLWDGWDCIRESTPTSTTHYLIPEGQLLGFRRDGEQYSVASDALGCVRLVTDSSGAVVFRRDYGAWGETLPGGFDSVPGGMPYGFVGALGVRTDVDTGLLWMRQRWYDFTLQRFISRDPIGLRGGANLCSYANNAPINAVGANLYSYCLNSPLNFTDEFGLKGWAPRVGGAGLLGCLLSAYWEGKNYEAHNPRLPKDKCPEINDCGEWVYDKYVHCVTSCKMTKCFVAAGIVGGSVAGGVTGSAAGPIGIIGGSGMGAMGGHMVGATGGTLVVNAAGATFELVQFGASKVWGGHPLGHGSMADQGVNFHGSLLAWGPGDCIDLCCMSKFRGD